MADPEQTRAVHVFPVPRGMEPEDAWAEISTLGQLIEYRWWRLRFRWPFRKWAVVVIEPDEATFWEGW